MGDVSTKLVRRLIKEQLRSDSDLDAFCLDHFPDVYGRFTNGMDRVAKVNLLLQHGDPEVVAELLQAPMGPVATAPAVTTAGATAPGSAADARGMDAPAAFAWAVELVKEGQLAGAACVLDRLGLALGDGDFRGAAVGLIRRSRAVDRDLPARRVTPDAAEAERQAITDALIALIQQHPLSSFGARPAVARARHAHGSSLRAINTAPASTRPYPPRVARAMVRCEGIRKKYGHGFNLGPIDIEELRHGEILAIVGANGSGKTSLLRIIAGELAADGGRCDVAKVDASTRPLAVQAMFVPESPPGWSGTVERYLSWQAALFGHDQRRENREQVDSALIQLDVVEYKDNLWETLPDGIRMRVAIAAVVVANPGLIVLDEPLGPLDPRSQQELLQWMRDYARGDRKTTFVVSAHHVLEIESVADQVLYLAGPGRPASATRVQERGESSAQGTHFRIGLAAATDRAALRAVLADLRAGKTIESYLGLASVFLVWARSDGSLTVEELITALAGTGVVSVQDLSASNLRPLLWREP